jgi:uncharacterized protein with von Willebrand factor type A (vWA) domain
MPDLAAGSSGSVVGFVGALRAAGVDVPVGSTIAYAEALAALADRGVDGAYWAGRATLVRRPEDIAVYDLVFAGLGAGTDADAAIDVVQQLALDDGDADGDGTRPGDPRPAVRWSATETLAAKDLAACTDEELAEAHRLVADLRLRAALRRSRRRRPSPRGDRIDLRRTIAAELRGGDGRPRTTAQGTRPRRVVLLLDVSGSMAPYARALARFAHAAVSGRRRGQVEVFALGTRLTRITRELATHDPDAALQRAAAAARDWDGGTRLGAGLRQFNDEWGVRGIARRSIVVLLSDGWDRGDPAELATEAQRLRRVAHRVVWVNPLKASPGYAPLARGMAAALPHLDEFVEGHSVNALRDLVDVLAGDATRRPRRQPRASEAPMPGFGGGAPGASDA